MVSFLKAPGMNPAAMIMLQGLLVACSMYNGLETIFLQEHDIIMP